MSPTRRGPPRHFLQFKDLSRSELEHVFARTRMLKTRQRDGVLYQPLKGRTLAMLFEKQSTRTRVAFEAGFTQLGGSAIYLNTKDTQLGRGEPIEDVARVISRMVDVVMIRTFEQTLVERFAANSFVPVINGLTDEYHPCQILADIFTFIEHRGPIRGRTIAWIGDSNNMCNTWLQAANLLEFHLHVATPPGYEIEATREGADSPWIKRFTDPQEAVVGADLLTTDVWTSMGREAESAERRERFAPYRVGNALLSLAAPEALFMHCLPAHRGEEVEAELIDGPRSVVFEEAENRMHTQKALMEYLLLGHVEA